MERRGPGLPLPREGARSEGYAVAAQGLTIAFSGGAERNRPPAFRIDDTE